MKNESPRRTGQGATGAEDEIHQYQSIASSAPPQSPEIPATAGRQSVDEVACDFLRLILPDRGPFILWVRSLRGPSFNEFASTIEELWEKEKEWDTRGGSVYHACASFKEARRDPKGTPQHERRFGRTAHNVNLLRCLRLDVDAGGSEPGKPPKPYPNAQAATDALLDFAKATGLPTPMLVFSGNGVHGYWALERALKPSEWKKYAIGLKALCVRQNLYADAGKTSDVATVLRTPGTHNRKFGEKLVRLDQMTGRYQLEQFSFLLGVASTNVENQKRNGFRLDAMPLHLHGRPKRELNAAALDGIDFSVLADDVANQCTQVAALRDSKGVLEEPRWYAVLGVLAFCADGQDKGHEWSRG